MTNTVLLRELMNTRFMINSLTGRFTTCLEKCVNEGLTLDLNGCRFGPECSGIMYKYYSKIDFCNSEDEVLDEILKNNMLAARQQPEEYEELDLTRACTVEDYLDNAYKLPVGAKYNVKVNLGNIRNKAILVLLIMTRPDIEFDIRSCAADIFEFVRDFWISSSEPHDTYQELIAPNITIREKTPNGKFGAKDYGFYNEYDFIRVRKVLPIEFGNSQIIKLDVNSQVSDEWHAVVEKCLNVLDTAKQSKRVPGKTVKDFLTFREDD